MRHGVLAIGLATAFVLAMPSVGDTYIPFENRSTAAIPTHSPLHFLSFDSEQYDAKFEGAIILTGKFNIRYEPPADGEGGYFAAWFNPDDKFVRLLPYWQEYVRGRPKELEIDNGAAFIKAILSAKQRHALKNSPRRLLVGHIAIKVDRFHMNVTCDHPIYMVRFLSIEKPAQQIAQLVDQTTESC